MAYFKEGTNQGADNQEPNPNQGSTDNQEDYLAKVMQDKGEQFNVAKGYIDSQDYIKQLEQQATELREDLGKKTYADDIIKQLQAGQAKPSTEEPTEGDKTTGTTKTGDTTPALSEDKLKSLISDTLTQRERDATSNQNLRETEAKLKELFGTEVDKEVDKRSAQVGISKENLQKLAAESPTAFFKLLGEEVKFQTNSLAQGTINTAEGFNNNRAATKDFKHYQELRRAKPNEYYRPAMQNQMLKDRLAQGDSFYS